RLIGRGVGGLAGELPVARGVPVAVGRGPVDAVLVDVARRELVPAGRGLLPVGGGLLRVAVLAPGVARVLPRDVGPVGARAPGVAGLLVGAGRLELLRGPLPRRGVVRRSGVEARAPARARVGAGGRRDAGVRLAGTARVAEQARDVERARVRAGDGPLRVHE